MKHLLIFILAIFILGDTSARGEQTVLNFGLISTESAQNLKSQWQPLLDDMQKETGLPVKAYFASDYAGVIEAMRFDKVDIAWYGNKSAIEAVDRAGGEVFAQILSSDGYPGYHSVLIVHKDSPLQTLDDLLKAPETYSFGNGDPNSTSGFLIPSYYVFAKNRIDPKTHFTRVTNASHEVNALGVAKRQIDVATNNTSIIGDPEREPKAGRLWKTRPEMAENIRVIWKSPLIPHEPLVYRKDLPEETKKTICDFFYNYGKTENQKKILSAINEGIGEFKPSTNEQLAPIREIERFRDELLAKEE